MVTLIQNECIKLGKKVSTAVMLILLVVFTFLATILLRTNNTEMTGATFFSELGSMTSLVNMFVVIVTASIVAEEFSRGTIKFLLIRPFSRSQILAAKMITCFLFGVVGTIIAMLSSFVFGQLLLKSGSLFAAAGSLYPDWNYVQVALANAGSNFILILFYISITLFISAVIRSQSLAVGVGIGFLFGGAMINGLLLVLMQKHEWLKWTPFNMMNIRATLQKSVSSELTFYLNFWQMLAGLLLYSVVIYFFTNLIFNKRDVSLS